MVLCRFSDPFGWVALATRTEKACLKPSDCRITYGLAARRCSVPRAVSRSLDRNAKTRIIVFAKAWNAKHEQPGQHRGPLTRATHEVLEALLWGFHNSKSGLCFPSYEAIAKKAEWCRDTVYEGLPDDLFKIVR